nr:hypothetical protein [Tanacetum cinerariifolium]
RGTGHRRGRPGKLLRPSQRSLDQSSGPAFTTARRAGAVRPARRAGTFRAARRGPGRNDADDRRHQLRRLWLVDRAPFANLPGRRRSTPEPVQSPTLPALERRCPAAQPGAERTAQHRLRRPSLAGRPSQRAVGAR